LESHGRPPIQLWKTNLDGSPKLLNGVPNLVPYHPSRGHDGVRSTEKDQKFISIGSFKYVELWKHGIEQSAPYAMKMNLNVDYWEDILSHL
jgi:hypothetical protein